MEGERTAHLISMEIGAVSSYSTGQFAFKIFSDVGRLSTEEVESRVNTPKQRDGRKWLTRTDFPVGSAGWLIFQAKTLLAGIDHRAIWDKRSFVGSSEFDTHDDGSLFVPDRPDDSTDPNESKESRVLRWMGSTMIAAMNSAFACELTRKAIALTCNDQAKKIHDLALLLDDLPNASRHRMHADYREMASLFERKRQTFGAWRYFERDAGEGGTRGLIDVAAARGLGRAARVLLDEAEVVGLRAGFAFEATRSTEDSDGSKVRRDHFKIRVTGGESPPPQP